jgi:DNA-binding NarL/FixJ family response regulator
VGTRIVLIEDHPALRKGLGLLLRSRGCDVLATAGDAAGARELVETHAPQVAVIDVHLGSESGIALTRELTEHHPETRVVLYTGSEADSLVREGLDAGAFGYLLKNGEIDELLEGIAAAAAGRRHVDPRLRAAAAGPRPVLLSKRERQIMDLLASGLTGEQVAERLVLSAETVKTHVRNAMGKLEATTRVHAVALALRDGQISPPPLYAARSPK